MSLHSFITSEDMLVIPQARGSTRDPSADQETGLTTNVGVLATRPLTKTREKFERAIIPFSKKTAESIAELRSALNGKNHD